MTFTDLELVLLGAVGAMLFINHKLSKKLDIHREAHAVILHVIKEVADKKARLIRRKDGDIGVEQVNQTEKHNATSI